MPAIDILLNGTSINQYVASFSVQFSEAKVCNELNLVLNDNFFYDTIAGDLFGATTNYLPSSPQIEVKTGNSTTADVSQGTFYIERPSLTIDKKGNASAISNSIWGRNSIAILDNPFSPPLFLDIENIWGVKELNASTLITNIASLYGITIYQFDITDYKITSDWQTEAFPIDLISKIAKATNGYVRSTKDGKLWIKKHSFHNWGSIGETFTDDNLLGDITVKPEVPSFTNRVSFVTMAFDLQNVNLSLSVTSSLLAANGVANTAVEVVITDREGNPVSNGTIVNWNIEDTSLGVLSSAITETGDSSITNEEQTASSHNKVSTEYPIKSVSSVTIDGIEYYTSGSSFQGSTITLATNLPFNNSVLLISYVGSGIATNILTSINTSNADNQTTNLHAIVDKMRDSVEISFNVPGISSSGDKEVTIVVKDRITGSSVIGAEVTVDGSSRGVTNSSGSISLGITTEGAHTVSITASGYRDTATDGLSNDNFVVT